MKLIKILKYKDGTEFNYVRKIYELESFGTIKLDNGYINIMSNLNYESVNIEDGIELLKATYEEAMKRMRHLTTQILIRLNSDVLPVEIMLDEIKSLSNMNSNIQSLLEELEE